MPFARIFNALVFTSTIVLFFLESDDIVLLSFLIPDTEEEIERDKKRRTKGS